MNRLRQVSAHIITRAMSSQIYDGLIIGGGPAGLAAALPFGRVNRTAKIFDSRAYRNQGAHAMHMVPGLDHFNPVDFRDQARGQLARYKGIEVEEANIVSAKKEADFKFVVADEQGRTWTGRTLVLATGSEDIFPKDVEGYKENWPDHIYQCPFCDGLESSGLPVGVLSFPVAHYEIYVAAGFKFDSTVIIFMNGEEPPQDEATQAGLKTALARGAKLESRRIKRLVNNGPGPTDGVTVEFEDGGSVKCGCIYHKPDTANRAQHLIEQLGIETNPPEAHTPHLAGEIKLGQFGGTSVPGCFAGGDTIAMYKMSSAAIASGTMAGAGACITLGMEEGKAALAKA